MTPPRKYGEGICDIKPNAVVLSDTQCGNVWIVTEVEGIEDYLIGVCWANGAHSTHWRREFESAGHAWRLRGAS